MRSDDKDCIKNDNQSGLSNDDELHKKDYYAPQLFIYGNIRELTQASGSGAKHDSIVHATKN